nr:immunoglobulin light chain junction region [Macaca mulatta]MOW68266.1 immunoglobulin light chain junction region [Macaca mulatta]
DYYCQSTDGSYNPIF